MTVDPAALSAALRSSHRLYVDQPTRIAAGVTTANYSALDASAGPVFIKVYAADADLAAEEQAIAVTEFAAAAGLPTAEVIRSVAGRPIIAGTGVAYSVWRFIDAPSGQRDGLDHEQLADMGAVLGRLHARLAEHPVSLANSAARVAGKSLTVAAAQLASLVGPAELAARGDRDSWTVAALRERIAVIDRIRVAVPDTLDWSTQVIHGDLAGPNVLLAAGRVAAIIDFQPPTVGAIAHDISRIGCDPRTVLTLGDSWPSAMAAMAAAYLRTNAGAPTADVVGSVRWWIRHTAASTYPLRTLIEDPAGAGEDLSRYARHRHEALFAVLGYLDVVERQLRSCLTT